MGHDARGAQNLGETKLDMFMEAVEGWLNSVAAVLNRVLLPRLWKLNAFNPDLMPEYVPDTAQRLDLDVLSAFMLRLAQAGMPLFPDQELESYIRDAAGLPDISDPGAAALVGDPNAAQQALGSKTQPLTANPQPLAPGGGGKPGGPPMTKLDRVIRGSLARRAKRMGM
jgi:phage gp29-like protein